MSIDSTVRSGLKPSPAAPGHDGGQNSGPAVLAEPLLYRHADMRGAGLGAETQNDQTSPLLAATFNARSSLPVGNLTDAEPSPPRHARMGLAPGGNIHVGRGRVQKPARPRPPTYSGTRRVRTISAATSASRTFEC